MQCDVKILKKGESKIAALPGNTGLFTQKYTSHLALQFFSA